MEKSALAHSDRGVVQGKDELFWCRCRQMALFKEGCMCSVTRGKGLKSVAEMFSVSAIRVNSCGSATLNCFKAQEILMTGRGEGF